MNNAPVCITSDNLSRAWFELFQATMQSPRNELTPAIVTISGLYDGIPDEDQHIREILDRALLECQERSSETVSSTIFPMSLWNPTRSRHDLYKRFSDVWPRVRRHQGNANGTYFQRLIAFGAHEGSVNQLEHIISTYRDGNHRRSALQAAIFDPTKDHTHQRVRGFPCLQHVLFTPDHRTRQLTVTGLYAKQHIFEKAYGNYLGLCRLGKFMAHEMDLNFTRMVCITTVASLGNKSEQELRGLYRQLEQVTSDAW